MTLYLETLDGFVVWTGQPIGDGEDAVCHPLHIEQLWSAGALADWGLYVPAEADPVPEGKVVTETHVERVGEVVQFVHTLEDAPPPTVPQSVSMRQARLALLSAGLLSTVETSIDKLEEPDRSAALIEWEYATEMRRDRHLIAALAVEMSLTEQQIDDLFIAAAAL